MGHDDVVIRFRSKLVKHKVVQADNHGHPVEAKKKNAATVSQRHLA
jgi:hypothetical protein